MCADVRVLLVDSSGHSPFLYVWDFEAQTIIRIIELPAPVQEVVSVRGTCVITLAAASVRAIVHSPVTHLTPFFDSPIPSLSTPSSRATRA